MGKLNSQAVAARLTVDWTREISKPVTVVDAKQSCYFLKEVSKHSFCTGSSYEGQEDVLGFAGVGSYVYPHGAVYEGYFKDGQFHGDGTITYPNGDYVEGIWDNGKLTNPIFNFSDGLKHEEPWRYCEFPDRRFKEEEDALTLDHELPKRYQAKIPPNCYFTGDGYYEPDMRIVYSKNNRVLRVVTKKEESEIKEKYRREKDENVEYMAEFYEFWTAGKARDVEEVEDAFLGEES